MAVFALFRCLDFEKPDFIAQTTIIGWVEVVSYIAINAIIRTHLTLSAVVAA
jgi:hypothetical protein